MKNQGNLNSFEKIKSTDAISEMTISRIAIIKVFLKNKGKTLKLDGNIESLTKKSKMYK